MKKIIIRICIGIAVLVVIGLITLFFSLNVIVKKGVETVGPEMTKVDVTLGSAAILPFSGSGTLNKLFVGNPEGYKSKSAIEAGEIKVGVGIRSLTSDVIVVNEVSVKDALITMEGSPTDNNLTKILANVNGSNTGQPKPKGEPPQPGTSKSSKKFIVKDLVIEGAKVNLNLSVLGKSLSGTVPIPTIHLQNIGVAENGVTAEQLVQEVMKPLLADVLTAATDFITHTAGNLKDLGKSGLNGVGNAAKGVTDLFHKNN